VQTFFFMVLDLTNCEATTAAFLIEWDSWNAPSQVQIVPFHHVWKIILSQWRLSFSFIWARETRVWSTFWYLKQWHNYRKLSCSLENEVSFNTLQCMKSPVIFLLSNSFCVLATFKKFIFIISSFILSKQAPFFSALLDLFANIMENQPSLPLQIFYTRIFHMKLFYFFAFYQGCLTRLSQYQSNFGIKSEPARLW